MARTGTKGAVSRPLAWRKLAFSTGWWLQPALKTPPIYMEPTKKSVSSTTSSSSRSNFFAAPVAPSRAAPAARRRRHRHRPRHSSSPSPPGPSPPPRPYVAAASCPPRLSHRSRPPPPVRRPPSRTYTHTHIFFLLIFCFLLFRLMLDELRR